MPPALLARERHEEVAADAAREVVHARKEIDQVCVVPFQDVLDAAVGQFRRTVAWRAAEFSLLRPFVTRPISCSTSAMLAASERGQSPYRIRRPATRSGVMTSRYTLRYTSKPDTERNTAVQW